MVIGKESLVHLGLDRSLHPLFFHLALLPVHAGHRDTTRMPTNPIVQIHTNGVQTWVTEARGTKALLPTLKEAKTAATRLRAAQKQQPQQQEQVQPEIAKRTRTKTSLATASSSSSSPAAASSASSSSSSSVSKTPKTPPGKDLLPPVDLKKMLESGKIKPGFVLLEQLVQNISIQEIRGLGFRVAFFDPGQHALFAGVDDDPAHDQKPLVRSSAHYHSVCRHGERTATRAVWDHDQKQALNELSRHSLATLEPATLKASLNVHLGHLHQLHRHYGQIKWRRLAFSSRVSKSRALALLADQLLGKDRKTIVFVGDCATQTGFRKNVSAPVVELREYIARFGMVVLVDEWGTSSVCSSCDAHVSTSSRDGGSYKAPKCLGCGLVHQRDVNAAANVRSIVRSYFGNKGRPANLRRDSMLKENT